MAVTREFKDTVMDLCRDPEYRKGLLLEALESYLEGNIVVGNSLLRDYLNGTQVFDEVRARAVSDRLKTKEDRYRADNQ